MKDQTTKEIDLALPVVRWLREWKWDVWQEIMFRSGEARADICAVRHDLLWIIEVKKALTFDLIAQARLWPVHYRSIAVPVARLGRGRTLAYQVCRDQYIGVLEVGFEVEERIPARFLRTDHVEAKRMMAMLADIPQDYAPAGSPSGNGYRPWTSYRSTMDRVRKFLDKHPGATIKDILAEVDHHYVSTASARSAIPKWLETAESWWCRTEYDGKRRFFVRDDAPPIRTDGTLTR